MINEPASSRELTTRAEPAVQESILSDLVDSEQYERPLKNARIWLYIVSGIQLTTGFYEYVTIDDNFAAALALAIDTGIALTFFVLALWSKKKPEAAFLSALVIYVLFIMGLTTLDSGNLFRGIIIKVVVVIALIKAYNSAREYGKIKASLGEEV